jgi:FKBP-type peptidyl-prolyl cis-trans isomerase
MNLKWMAVAGAGLLAVVGVGLATARAAKTQQAPVLKSQKEKLSYEIGVNLARGFQRQGVEVDVDLMTKALRDVVAGKKLLMTEEELRQTMAALQAELKQKQAQDAKVAAEARQKQGDAFLAENAKKQGVVTLPSGLQYKVLKAGDGEKPTDTDAVDVQYRGTLVDGTEFDSSYRRGKPGTFKLTGVIPGMREALKLMPIGSKWQLVIPPKLAYGPRGAGGAIGPNSTLLFDLELVGIKGPQEAAAAGSKAPEGRLRKSMAARRSHPAMAAGSKAVASAPAP